MNNYFENMNETYIAKHYPKRSLFESVAKNTKKNGIGAYIFSILLLAGSLACLFFLIKTFMQNPVEDTDLRIFFLVVGAILLLFAIISIWLIIITFKRNKKGAKEWRKQSAKNSKLNEEEILEFEKQAIQSNSYILKLTSGINAVLSDNKDGILTRDYIYLADLGQTVHRCDKLISACLVEHNIRVHTGSRRQSISYLYITLLSDTGVESSAEVTKESGHALLQLLLEKNHRINICNGQVLNSGQYKEYKKATFHIVD